MVAGNFLHDGILGHLLNFNAQSCGVPCLQRVTINTSKYDLHQFYKQENPIVLKIETTDKSRFLIYCYLS